MSITFLNQSAPLDTTDSYWPVLCAILMHKFMLDEVHITVNDVDRLKASFSPGSDPRIEAKTQDGYISVRIVAQDHVH